MSLDKDWESIRPQRSFRAADAGMGLLRITLLFGSAAAALALLATPILERSTKAELVYTMRRSVLQPTPESVCIISPSGQRSGEC